MLLAESVADTSMVWVPFESWVVSIVIDQLVVPVAVCGVPLSTLT